MNLDLAFKTREITLTSGESVMVSNETTANMVFNGTDFTSDGARAFDETIYYYCADDDFVNMTDEELSQFVSEDTDID